MHAAKRQPNFTLSLDQLIHLSDRAVLAKWRADFLFGHKRDHKILTTELHRRGYNASIEDVTARLQ